MLTYCCTKENVKGVTNNFRIHRQSSQKSVQNFTASCPPIALATSVHVTCLYNIAIHTATLQELQKMTHMLKNPPSASAQLL